MTTTSRLKVGSLCSGYDGIALAVETVLDTELAWYSEIDPAACAVMEAHWPDVANIGDLTVLDWEKVPRVDVITAGYPCQPFQPRRPTQRNGR